MNEMMKKFVKFAKEEYGYDVSFEKTLKPDTFKDMFGFSFNDKDSNSFNKNDEKGGKINVWQGIIFIIMPKS